MESEYFEKYAKKVGGPFASSADYVTIHSAISLLCSRLSIEFNSMFVHYTIIFAMLSAC